MITLRRLKLRRGTSTEWATANPVLAAGEPGYDLTTGDLKIGDGTTAHTALPVALSGTYSRGSDVTTPLRNFMRRLRTGTLPSAVLVQGDSTGNETNEWVYLTAQWLATQFPAYTVTHRLWNDTTQGYDPFTLVQTGTAGLRRFTDTGTNSASKRIFTIADSAATSPVGDLDVRVQVNLAGGGLATRGILCGKYTSSGNQISWRFGLDPDNTLLFSWSANGSALVGTFSSTAALSGVGQLSSDIWLRATLDVDNGAVGSDLKFYTSTDGTVWTQLGATVTNSGVTSIFDSTSTTQLVGFNGSTFGAGVAPTTQVQFIRFQVLPGLTGVAPVIDADFGQYDGYSTSWVDHCGNTVSANVGSLGTFSGAPSLAFYNCSASGQAVAYSSDSTRFAKQAVGTVQLAFVSYGHNDALVTAYRTPYKALTDLIVAKWTGVGVVCVAQNGEISPRTAGQIATHAMRMQQVADFAAEQGFQLLDAFDALQAADPTLATVLDVDGIHPNAAGKLAWYGALRRLLNAALRA